MMEQFVKAVDYCICCCYRCKKRKIENSFFKSLLVLLIRDIFNLVLHSAEYGLLYVNIEFNLKHNNEESMFIFVTRCTVLAFLMLYAVMMLFILIHAEIIAEKIRKREKQENRKLLLTYFLVLKVLSFIVGISIFIHCAAINNSFGSAEAVLPFLNKISSVQGTEQWIVWSLSLVSVADIVLDFTEISIESYACNGLRKSVPQNQGKKMNLFLPSHF